MGDRLHDALAAKGPGYVPRTRHRREDGTPIYVNRLILESSPYLLQHAHNPVDWYPWGDEAFEVARATGRPVFLSVGYSTCHWCHVMEEESFEDLEIAALLDERFVPVKVDREARPDVDGVYMAVVQSLTGRGGWPMSVWLTPDREAFFAGTYFPPRAGVRGARAGFVEILRELADRYEEDPSGIVATAARVSEHVRAMIGSEAPGDLPGTDAIRGAVRFAAHRFDAVNGGVRGAPKFPSSFPVRLLLRYARRAEDEAARSMARKTLLALARGGIRDHVGGGFHRYATDSRWLVPHFEKMLYDNALLATTFVEGASLLADTAFAATARDTLDYLLREMRAPDGTFYSATDADSLAPSGEREEGYYFTFTPSELEAVLGAEDARLAAAYYDVTPAGNFEGRSVLSTPRPASEVAAELGLSAGELDRRIAIVRARLYDARLRRPSPLRDEKVIVAWNALAITAFARAAIVLGDVRYADAAERAARALLAETRAGRPLPHLFVGGRPEGAGFLDDHVFLASALLDLFELTADPSYLRDARALLEHVDERFRDGEHGGYFLTPHDGERLFAREKPDHDGAVPSPNSVIALAWQRLASITGEERFRERGEATLRAFAGALASRAPSLEQMLLAVDYVTDVPKEIAIVLPEGSGAIHPSARPFLDALARDFVPNAVLVVASEAVLAGELGNAVPWARGKRALHGLPTAYVCQEGTCSLPATDVTLFERHLAVAHPYP